MKEKNLVILCIIFAVLIGLLFLKQNVKPDVPTTEEITDIVASPVNLESINAMILRLGDGSGGDQDNPKKVHLVKSEEKWTVESQFGVSARDTVLKSSLEKLDQAEGELRSNKKGLLADYGISDEEGAHVELTRPSGEPLHVIIGTKNAGYQNNFVRHNGSNAVYVVNDNLLGAFGVRIDDDDHKLDANRWTDKRISQIDAAKVVGIEITESDGAVESKVIDLKQEMIEDKKQWQSATAYAFGLSASKIKSVIENFNNTYAKDVISPDDEGIFDAPGWKGVFTLDNGEQVTLVRGPKDEEGSNYYLKREGAGYYFLVPESTFHSRKNQQGLIFADNPLKVDEKTLEKVEVKVLDAGKEFSAVKKEAQSVSEEDAEEGAEDDSAENAEKKGEVAWESLSGEAVETGKVQDVLNKLKTIGVEAVSKPSMSLKNTMSISITREGESAEYSISEIHKSATDKECHFLSVGGDTQSYCVSKSQITSLQNSLP